MSLSRDQIYLIGYQKVNLNGCKLPSIGDCLRVFFYNLRTVKLPTKDSARLVIKECSIFWEKARIPIQATDKAEKKLIKLYEEWRELHKHKSRESDTYKKKREDWQNFQNDLFDIAHQNANDLIKIEEDRQFLINQRVKGRKGCMSGVDVNLKKREERREKRLKQIEIKRKIIQEAPSTSKGKYLSSDESENEGFTETEDDNINPNSPNCSSCFGKFTKRW